MSCTRLSLSKFKKKSVRELAQMTRGDTPFITVPLGICLFRPRYSKAKNLIVTKNETVLSYHKHSVGGKSSSFKEAFPNYKTSSETDPKCQFQLVPKPELRNKKKRNHVTLKIRRNLIKLQDGSELTNIFKISLNSEAGNPDRILIVQETK